MPPSKPAKPSKPAVPATSGKSGKSVQREAEATIHDVAREANVSIATVSRALNGDLAVREGTRERVEAVIKELGYVPHGGARSLKMRQTRTLGVLLPDLFGEFFSEVIRGLDQVTRQRGYSLLVTCTHGDSSSAETMLRALHGRVDGLVVLGSDMRMQSLLDELPRRTPVVFLNRAQGGNRFESINVDNFGGAYAMTRHLLDLGHERIAFLKGPAENHDACERLGGYHAAMAEQGSFAQAVAGDFTEDGGFRAAGKILDLPLRPTAIFAANDAMAIGALCALKERQVRVPEDISLAGFDDIPMMRFLSPPLSSIRTPIPELGSNAALRLLDMIEGGVPMEPRQQVLEVLLVARASTASPSSPAPAPAPPPSSTPATLSKTPSTPVKSRRKLS